MTALATTEEFLQLVKSSRLLSQVAFRELSERLTLAELPTPAAIADALVAADVVTRYQANRLLTGSRRGLFIDNYKIREILGSGGMGYLYSAEDLESGFIVALKVLSDRHRSDRGMLTRFQLEAEAGLRLVHPNIVRTKAINRTEDIYGVIHYMVMELVRGLSLFELLLLRRRPLSCAQACDVIVQAATGLQYAHEQGLVHRDIKPENLLIRQDGMVKVLDFGLAMITDGEGETSLASILGQKCLGTADYIAPEQSIDSRDVDARADIYSLGCTLYSLLAGRVPFQTKKTSHKLESHRKIKATPVHEINPKVPERISKIIQKAMSKRPENRFQTAAEFAGYLAQYAQRKEINFDFEKILVKRAELAERRLAAESNLRGDSRTSTISELEIGKRRGVKGPDVETIIEKETILERRKP